ncbi:MAG: hypothetical protein N2C14_27420 [Planctomycetales bacterium]
MEQTSAELLHPGQALELTDARLQDIPASFPQFRLYVEVDEDGIPRVFRKESGQPILD